MKEINQYRLLIKLFYFIFSLSILLFPIRGLFAFMENDITYLGEYSEQNTFSKLILFVFIIKIVSKIIFFLGGFYLIKILKFEDIQEIFSDKNIFLFKKAGKLFITSSVVGTVVIWLDYFRNGIGNLKGNNDFLYSLYFSAIVGLFLLIFSKILEKAKELKQENDLTI
ncbi:DUF2975 domain-containing protein [Polaribacter marinivivus]|uniref:DUF2975 domain-containing protein n=1 Tax=Polaribacter marinivivus TaxID=1524260 RepID=A0ABV8R7Y4_9FLAO